MSASPDWGGRALRVAPDKWAIFYCSISSFTPGSIFPPSVYIIYCACFIHRSQQVACHSPSLALAGCNEAISLNFELGLEGRAGRGAGRGQNWGVIFQHGALLASSCRFLTFVKAKTFSVKDKQHETSTGMQSAWASDAGKSQLKVSFPTPHLKKLANRSADDWQPQRRRVGAQKKNSFKGEERSRSSL